VCANLGAMLQRSPISFRVAVLPQLLLPKRMILIRHGESAGNVDASAYSTTPDWKIPLTLQGEEQAFNAGKRLAALVGHDPLYFFVSPYNRTKQTLRQVLLSIREEQIINVREDPRLREQDTGNLQNAMEMGRIWKERDEFGRFFYRFPNGENGADVCDRVSSFLEMLNREREIIAHPHETNQIIVTHGLLMRLFVKRWFHLPVDAFHLMVNPPNCNFVIFERQGKGREQRLAITEESKEMLGIPADVRLHGRYETKNWF
jgi:broad specificity phosphatase PhoE